MVGTSIEADLACGDRYFVVCQAGRGAGMTRKLGLINFGFCFFGKTSKDLAITGAVASVLGQ